MKTLTACLVIVAVLVAVGSALAQGEKPTKPLRDPAAKELLVAGVVKSVAKDDAGNLISFDLIVLKDGAKSVLTVAVTERTKYRKLKEAADASIVVEKARVHVKLEAKPADGKAVARAVVVKPEPPAGKPGHKAGKPAQPAA